MDEFFILMAFGILALLFGGAVSGLVALGRIKRLERRIAVLEGQASKPDRVAAADIPRRQMLARSSKPLVKTARQPDTLSSPDLKPKPVRPPRKPARTPKPKLDLETLLGAKGSVWIGGLALLLGAVFLLRYTMEAGLLTPLMRVSFAGLLGLTALGLSEWLARRDLKTPVGQALSARADIPALLAAVGIFSLFGAIYAAHALYGLLGTLPAFIGMAAVAVGAMALSLRRGPWLAAVGLIGALVVPLLVASVTPSFIGVFAYVGLITGAALWVARRQSWDWLLGAAAIGATVWLAILSGKAVDSIQFALWTVGLAGAMALTLRSLDRSPVIWPRWTFVGWLGVVVLMGLASAASDDVPALSYSLPFLTAAALLLFAVTGDVRKRWPALLIGGAVVAVHTIPFMIPWSPRMDWPWQAVIGALSVATALASLRVGARWVDDQRSTALTTLGGALAVALTASGFAELHARPVPPINWACFALAGLFAVASWTQARLSVARGAAWVAALAWIVGTCQLPELWSSSVVPSLDPTSASQLPELWPSSLVLSLGIAAMTGLALRRDDLWVWLTPLAMAGVAGLVASAALEDSAAYIVTTPFLNELWLYFGLPGVLTAAGAFLLRRKGEDLASQGLLGGAIVFTLLLIVLLIHHAMNAGDLTAQVGFEALAVQLLVLFTALFGASWMRGGLTDWPSKDAEPRSYIVPGIAVALSLGSLAAFVLGQGLEFNPLLTASTAIDGHPVFNALLLAYLAPAILLGLSALRFAGRRPIWFVRTLGALAGASWLMWTTAQIRRIAQGEVIAMNRVSWANGELYAVSAVWLLTGLALLLAGVKTGRRDLRLASAILITLTTLKVFLVDMRALDGAFRAVSFIGLGIALIGIGRLYQRVLSKPTDNPAS